MLTIGEFSNICRVSTKTLRYYAEIGLILPDEINPENGYRYYSIDQLEKMLLINRLKAYCFSLEEIKSIFESEELIDEILFTALNKKKKEIANKNTEVEDYLHQIDNDISNLKRGKPIISYMESIDVQLVEIPMMYLLSIRKNVLEHEFSEEYGTCFGKLFRKMEEKKLTAAAPPMVLFMTMSIHHWIRYGICNPNKRVCDWNKRFLSWAMLENSCAGFLLTASFSLR